MWPPLRKFFLNGRITWFNSGVLFGVLLLNHSNQIRLYSWQAIRPVRNRKKNVHDVIPIDFPWSSTFAFEILRPL